MYHDMMDGWGYNNGYGAWGWLFMLFWIALIILAIIFLVRYLGRGGSNALHGEDALDILRKRYAKGEIDKKEFQEKTKDLKSE